MKQLKRVFRKVAKRMGDDLRDDRPTFDAQSFHEHEERVAATDYGEEKGLQNAAPNYPSPTL